MQTRLCRGCGGQAGGDREQGPGGRDGLPAGTEATAGEAAWRAAGRGGSPRRARGSASPPDRCPTPPAHSRSGPTRCRRGPACRCRSAAAGAQTGGARLGLTRLQSRHHPQKRTGRPSPPPCCQVLGGAEARGEPHVAPVDPGGGMVCPCRVPSSLPLAHVAESRKGSVCSDGIPEASLPQPCPSASQGQAPNPSPLVPLGSPDQARHSPALSSRSLRFLIKQHTCKCRQRDKEKGSRPTARERSTLPEHAPFGPLYKHRTGWVLTEATRSTPPAGDVKSRFSTRPRGPRTA